MDSLVLNELYIFLKIVYGGVILGFLYDLYRLFRYYLNPKKIATAIEDIIFWIIVTFISFYILLISNYGELRGFIFLGFVIGVLLYSTLFSDLIIKTQVKLINNIINLMKYLISLVIIPFAAIIKLFKKVFSKISPKVKLKYKRSKRIIKTKSRIIEDIKKSVRIIKK